MLFGPLKADSFIQVEYAVKAVENGGTCVGIRCKDGVVLAVEKIITSKLLKPGANRRIATVDRNVGVVSASLSVSLRDQTRICGYRYLQAWFQMVDILCQEHEMRLHHGGQHIKHLFLLLLSLVDWVATSKHTLSTQVSGPLG